jgi:ribonuclease P protein component
LTSREGSPITRANRAATANGPEPLALLGPADLRAHRRLPRETDLSAQQIGAQAPPRLSLPHGDRRRPQGSLGAARAWASEIERLGSGRGALVSLPYRLQTCCKSRFRSQTQNRIPKSDPKVAPMERLKRRMDFRAAAAGARVPAKAFVLQARRRNDIGADQDAVRLGFTVSKQVGNAVIRNRVRRRLKEMVRLTPQASLCAGHDYVLIGRRAALQRPFGDMMRDLDTVVRRVHSPELARELAGTRAATGAANMRPPHKAGSPSRPPRHQAANSTATISTAKSTT